MDESLDQIIAEMIPMPERILFEATKTALTRQLLPCALAFAKHYSFLDFVLETTTDGGKSVEEESVLESDGLLQFALEEHGERAFPSNLSDEKILLLTESRDWKKMVHPEESTSEETTVTLLRAA